MINVFNTKCIIINRNFSYICNKINFKMEIELLGRKHLLLQDTG
jgi:hypothetical protein